MPCSFRRMLSLPSPVCSENSRATLLLDSPVSTRFCASTIDHVRRRPRLFPLRGSDSNTAITRCPGGPVTLRDGADYITCMPKSESDPPEWQTAIEVVLLCSRVSDPMLARIGVMKALNCHVERVSNPERKDHHWGKRKLKRDQ